MADLIHSGHGTPARALSVLRLVRLIWGAGAMLAVQATPSNAQAPAPTDTAQAQRLTQPVRLDGRLTEDVWRSAPAITRFTQREPNEGQPAIENSEVRIAYDDDALYVGARMFSRNPADIRALVTRRDHPGISEFIGITFDTYLDRRTAYSFAVTPSGVRLDLYHSADNGDGDAGYDPVWEARAQVDSLGWTAEMRIPFNQLRFSPRDEQVWGINVIRRVPARNEESYWRLIRRQETGWASRMGILAGIRGIAPARRVELLPYVASGSRIRDVTDTTNPFQHRTESEARVGADLKLGLGPNLTLDVALNPDFGQVEADPAVVNLSAFEVFFGEKRPFFTEGADLLDRRRLFYSRRIGAAPPVGADADYAEERRNSTILGAAKITGRLPSKLSLAGLAALTDREVVRTFDRATSAFGRAEVAPRSIYGALAAQQEFGRDASTLAGMVTFVQRTMEGGSPLANALPRTAASGVLDGRFRWAGGKYDLSYFAGATNVEGDSLAILRQQRSSRRYWQRPDARMRRLDSSRTTLSGAFMGIGHSKMAGRHWLWDVDYTHESPAFEPNDIGALGTADNRNLSGKLVWRETRPSSWYRDYAMGVVMENAWSYDWLRRHRAYVGFLEGTLANYWRAEMVGYTWPRNFSDRLTRGGPVMGTFSGGGGQLSIQNREGARSGIELTGEYQRDESGGHSQELEVELSFRPGVQLEIGIDPEWSRERDTRQYVMTVAGGPVYGNRYVFSTVDVSEVSATLRVNYTFTPNLSLETYAEPFAASGRYFGFGELAAPRSRDLRVYMADPGSSITRNADGSHQVNVDGSAFTIAPLDFNVRSFRSNVVLRWEWRPGSTMFLVWQQDREADRAFRAARPSDLFDALRTRGDHFLALKVSYWLALD